MPRMRILKRRDLLWFERFTRGAGLAKGGRGWGDSIWDMGYGISNMGLGEGLAAAPARRGLGARKSGRMKIKIKKIL